MALEQSAGAVPEHAEHELACTDATVVMSEQLDAAQAPDDMDTEPLLHDRISTPVYDPAVLQFTLAVAPWFMAP